MENKKLFAAERQRLVKAGAGAAAMAQPTNAEVISAILSLKADVKALEAMVAQGVPALDPQVIEELHREISPEEEALAQQAAEVTILKTELRALAVCIEQTKAEIAALRPAGSYEDRLMTVTSELDAIVNATEGATHTILEAAEKIDTLTHTIAAQEKDSYIRHLADEISEHVIKIFESCNFQDITGQRITKVVRTLQYVEDRVNAMVSIWGSEGFENLPPPPDPKADLDPDHKLLNGPALENQGISQDDIDKLFG